MKNCRIHKNRLDAGFVVRGSGLEPPWVAPLAPKASASTISPPAQTMRSIAKNGEKCEIGELS